MIAIAWIIFGSVVVGCVAFCWFINRYYQDRREAEYLPSLVAVLGLTISLLCLFLIPVDIYNASSSSDANGQPLLTPEQISYRGNGLRIIYYVMYGLILMFCFIVIPFAYFYFEEHDEDVTIGRKIWGGCKYTIFLIVIITILMVVGLVLFLVKPGTKPTNASDARDMIESTVHQGNFAEASVGFAIAILTLIGYLIWLTYTAYGLSSLPIGLIKGRKHALEEASSIQNSLSQVKKENAKITSKYLSGSKKMGKRDEDKVNLLRRKERALNRQHVRLEGTQVWYRHIWTLMKPFTFLFGFLFILVSLLIIVSIILTNADKAINATKFCGSQCGFVLAYPNIFNPVDYSLTKMSKYFPLDYVFLVLIIMYIFFCTLSGISNIGIRFLWVHMFAVKPGSTPPQGLLLTAMLLMLSLLALNMEITTLAPRYAYFGSQVFYNTSSTSVEACNLLAPPGNCTLTQIGEIINTISIKTSFFGVIFYYISWVFVLCYLIGVIIAVVRSRKNNVEARESDSDEDES